MIAIKECQNAHSLYESATIEDVVDFLHTHLGKFRDDKTAIRKAIEYSMSNEVGKGGFILLACLDDQLVGSLVMIDLGMQEFIAEHILVYIAVDSNMRGQGIGKSLIERALSLCKGSIALHVEYDNPATHLYEKLGFTSKYAEMRWQNK